MKVHYRVDKSPTLSQIKPVHTLTPYLLRSILMLSFHFRQDLPSGLSSCFPINTLYAFPVSLCLLDIPPNKQSFIQLFHSAHYNKQACDPTFEHNTTDPKKPCIAHKPTHKWNISINPLDLPALTLSSNPSRYDPPPPYHATLMLSRITI